MSCSNIFETICNNHVMLLYDTDDQYAEIVINCINKGLARGQLCIYISKDSYNNESSYSLSNITSKILNYREHLLKGNLQIVNYKPCYESALRQDLTSLKEMSLKIKEASDQQITDNKRRQVLIIIDIESTLLHNKKYREAIIIGEFLQDTFLQWNQNSHNITLVCFHQHSLPSIIQGDKFIDLKNNFINSHILTVDLKDYYKQ